VFFLVIVAGLIGYSIGVTKIAVDWKNYQPTIEVTSKEPPPSENAIDFTHLWTVMGKLSQGYYDKQAIDPQKFLNGAIAGMVNSLDDPYTVYLPPAQNVDFKEGLAGRFEGIGAELGIKGKQIVVVAPLDGSPAQKAGLRAGDAILKVNSDITNGWTLTQAVERIRGEKGTEVQLTVQHKSDSKPIDVAIIRDTITVNSVTAWVKPVGKIDEIKKDAAGLKDAQDAKISYIRLSQFGDNTNAEWQKAAAKIDRDVRADPSIKGVILDLRNNPGGYLNDAVYIASEFIREGIVVSQEDRNKEIASYSVTGRGLLYDVPLVILINKGSASASEIVAGAMQDHKRAVLVGETSFGKGTIQQAEDLGGGAGLHVTVAKWLTPDKNWVHEKGLTPDVAVAVDSKDPSHDAQLEKAIEELVKNS
jgi:carboxyl-terminal processing protease